MADFMSTGNGYPSSATPFAMDLATPIMAISQQMVKKRQNEIAADKTTISENESLMLKALDFETVKGLSDKIQEEHVQAIDDLSSKWSGEFVKYGGKLTSAAKLQLERDKRSMETDIANKKANVLAYEEIRKKLEDPKAREYMDVDATAQAMAQWADSGRIGESPLGVLKLRQWDGGQIAMRDSGDFLKEAAKKQDEFIENARAGGVAIKTEDYDRIREDVMKVVLSNPELNTPAKIDQATKLTDTFLKNTKKEQYIRGFAPQKEGSSSEADKLANAKDFNETMSAALRGDSETLNSVQYKIQAKGRNLSVDEKGKKIVTWQFPDGRTASMHLIDENSSEADKRIAMIEYSSIYPAAIAPKTTKYFDPNAVAKEIKVAEPTIFEAFDQAVDKVKERTPDRDKKTGAEIPGTGKKGYEKAAEYLKKDLPSNFKTEITGLLNVIDGSRNIKITDTSTKPPTVKIFDYTDPDQREELKTFFRENSKTGIGVGGKKDVDPLGIL